MARRFRMTVEVESLEEDTTAKEVKALLKDVRGIITVMKVTAVDESPKPGVQAAFIYKNSAHAPCHAVVKKKNGPWSENRFGFCGTEPETGPVGSIDKPDGGLCSTCAKYVLKGDDGLWYVRENAPLPGPKLRATVDCRGCFDDD